MKKINKTDGQVMMIVVLVLSGIIIGATAISGLMTVRQTRQTADAGNSSKSVFAADAGLEWRMYKFIKDNYQCKDELCRDGGLFCDQRPFDNSILTTTCNLVNQDSSHYYYTISSSATFKDSSYTFYKDMTIPK
ncbi:MAG: hypothetical protein M1155_01520 [Patescibacteria group bacterium]|nr:hypothetical protein [Patescibacteria group bacterium]